MDELGMYFKTFTTVYMEGELNLISVPCHEEQEVYSRNMDLFVFPNDPRQNGKSRQGRLVTRR